MSIPMDVMVFGMMFRKGMQKSITHNTFAMDTNARQKAIRFIVDPLACKHIASRPANVVTV